MPGRSTIKAIYVLRRLVGNNREKKNDLNIVFTDFKRAYDKAHRDVIWYILESKDVTKEYIDVHKDTYESDISTIISKVGTKKLIPNRNYTKGPLECLPQCLRYG